MTGCVGRKHKVVDECAGDVVTAKEGGSVVVAEGSSMYTNDNTCVFTCMKQHSRCWCGAGNGTPQQNAHTHTT